MGLLNNDIIIHEDIKKDWNFAIYKKGYKDYNKKFTPQDIEEIKSISSDLWYIQTLSDKAFRIINTLDINAIALSKEIPCLGKDEIISTYNNIEKYI